MPEILNAIWNHELRLVPLFVSLGIFALLHYLRKLTKIEYTPSYLAIFPLSSLEYQLSQYFDEFYGLAYRSKKRGARKTLIYI